MKALKGLMGMLFVFGFLLVGLVQWAAIASYFSGYLGWWGIFAYPAAFVVGYIPLVGSLAGVVAAHRVWDWDLTNAVLLFFWPYALYVVFFSGAIVFGIGMAIFSKMQHGNKAVESRKAS